MVGRSRLIGALALGFCLIESQPVRIISARDAYIYIILIYRLMCILIVICTICLQIVCGAITLERGGIWKCGMKHAEQ